MFNRLLILVLLIILPGAATAITKLYACRLNGHTTLESHPSQHCDTLVEYRYPTYANHPKIPPKPVQTIQTAFPKAQARAFNDAHHDMCTLYTGLLKSALAYIKVKNDQLILIGPLRTAELNTQISLAKSHIAYYCHH